MMKTRAGSRWGWGAGWLLCLEIFAEGSFSFDQ